MDHIYTDEELLRRVKGRPSMAALGALRHLEQFLASRRRELILEARRLGWSWEDLGGVLRVTPQAVQQRWKRYVTVEDEAAEDGVER
jgi:hypothetical protein